MLELSIEHDWLDGGGKQANPTIFRHQLERGTAAQRAPVQEYGVIGKDDHIVVTVGTLLAIRCSVLEAPVGRTLFTRIDALNAKDFEDEPVVPTIAIVDQTVTISGFTRDGLYVFKFEAGPKWANLELIVAPSSQNLLTATVDEIRATLLQLTAPNGMVTPR